MTQPPDHNRPDWTPPAWSPPPPRGQQPPPHQPPPQQQPPQYGPPQYGPPQHQPPQYGPPQQQPWAAQPHQQQGPGSGAWEVLPGAGPDRPRGHRSRMIALIAAAVVVIAVIAGGVFLLRGDDKSNSSGGAASPQAAVSEFADAVAKQDVDAMLGLVDPAESRTLGAFITAARNKFGDTGIVAATGVPAPYLHIVLSGVQLQVDKVRPDLAFVSVTGGTGSVTADPHKVPPVVSGGQTEPRTSRASLAQGLDGVRIGAVRSGGHWFVSPTTTLLEGIRKRTGLAQPDFTVTPTTTGGASPQEAVTGLVTALNQKDVRGATGYFSAKELPALPYYYDVFAAQLRGRQGQLNGTIGNVDLSTQDMTNGLKKVTLEGATVSNGQDRVTYSRGCATVGGERRCIPQDARSLFALADPFFVVEQNNGKWQISPIATITEYLRTIVTDGNKNALLRRLNGVLVAPVVATLKVGDTTAVQLNDAGFAHVVITGTPGSCFNATPAGHDQYVQIDGQAYSSKCPDYEMPASGKIDAAVVQSRLAKATSELKISKG